VLTLVAGLTACNHVTTPADNERTTIDSAIKQLKASSFSNPDSAAQQANQLLEKAEDIAYTEGKARCLLLLSSIESLKGNYDTSIKLGNMALQFVDTVNQLQLTAEIYNEAGICYDYKSDYKKALDYYNKAQHFFTLSKDTSGYLKVRNNIGLVYQNTEQLPTARKYFQECLAIADTQRFAEERIMALSNLASVEIELGEGAAALQHFKEVYESDVKSGNETYISYSYNNLAEAFKQLNRFDSAEWYYQKSIELKEKLNLQTALLNSYKEYADLLFLQNRNAAAIEYLNKAFSLAATTGAREYLQQCYDLQAKIAAANKDYLTAYVALDSAESLKNEISGAKFKSELVAREKDYQLSLQQMELTKQKQLNRKEKGETIAFITISIILAVLVLVLGVTTRKLHLRNRLLSIQRQKVELYNKQLSLQKKQIEEGLEVKNKFLSFMAHEIRNPLGGILGLTDLLLNSGANDTQKEYLVYQKTAATNLLNLLNEVLDYQKLVSGQTEIQNIDFSLMVTLQQLQQLYIANLQEKKIRYTLSYDAAIPATLKGDPVRLTQVINNLLNNAIKFTPENGYISVTTQLVEKTATLATVRFTIADNGIGIEEQYHNKIFDLYGQANTGKRLHGTGLGLTIVKNILQLMNSSIELTSTPGEGSVFSFSIQFNLQ
jgi:hypothetical protein